ncbi:MAG: XRE family transcriptional regulator [Myxococcaceae bacterium]|nr:MAG: XRE family transcriptional regulator [Myxococcaceae bacterium]
MKPKASGSARYRSAGYADTVGRIASNVRRLRAAGRWTQEEVAARAGRLSPRLYRQIEAGTTNLTAATLTRIAEALETDVAELLIPAAPVRPTRGRPRKTPWGEGQGPSEGTQGERQREGERVGPPLLGVQGLLDGALSLPPLESPPSVLAGTAGNPRSPNETEASVPADALTEATRLARRVAEVRQALENRRNQLAEEALRIESALLNLTDTPGRVPTAALPAAPRVTTTAVAIPPLEAEHGVRGAVAVLLRANPGGLRTTELAEAIRSSSLRLRKNELHNTVRSMFDAGVLTREGFRGGFVYRLRAAMADELLMAVETRGSRGGREGT